MPYPILTLSHPFSRRLCQLLTPEELENLQLAAGPEIRNLKPIVQSFYDQNPQFRFFEDAAKVLLYLKDIDEITDNYTLSLLKCETLTFIEVTDLQFKNSDFSHIYFKANELAFQKCHLTVDYLKYVASIINAHGLLKLCLSISNDLDDDINFAFVFKTFPNLNDLSVGRAYNGWVNDLLNTNVTDLRSFSVYHNNYEELFSFKASDLHRFIKKQLPNFVVKMNVQCEPDATDDDLKKVKKKMKKLMTRRFRFRTSQFGKLKVLIYYYANPHFQNIACFYC
uniref:FTH domain-containing protein n=1 Tax=Panagrellus redivivus TaxID=6233 RepID=A0A7E4WD10_PANRE